MVQILDETEAHIVIITLFAFVVLIISMIIYLIRKGP